MDEFVKGLMGINKAYVGKYTNHYHICELKALGLSYGSLKRDIESFCPNKIKYKNMGKDDICDNCFYQRCLILSDDGNHIIDIE